MARRGLGFGPIRPVRLRLLTAAAEAAGPCGCAPARIRRTSAAASCSGSTRNPPCVCLRASAPARNGRCKVCVAKRSLEGLRARLTPSRRIRKLALGSTHASLSLRAHARTQPTQPVCFTHVARGTGGGEAVPEVHAVRQKQLRRPPLPRLPGQARSGCIQQALTRTAAVCSSGVGDWLV
jgi:hypothetical protein